MSVTTRTTSHGPTAAAVGERLRLTREALGLAQSQFADQCNIARNTYNQYERGHNVPQLDQAIRMREMFKLTLDWIYLGDNSGLPYHLVDKIAKSEPRRGERADR